MVTQALPGASQALPDATGHFDQFGGKFVPEALYAALQQLEDEFHAAQADPAPRYVLTAPPEPGNLRRIAAGWLSLHAGLYGLFGMLLAGGLAGTTRILVRNLGRHS